MDPEQVPSQDRTTTDSASTDGANLGGANSHIEFPLGEVTFPDALGVKNLIEIDGWNIENKVGASKQQLAEIAELLNAATIAKDQAQPHFSKFHVGAAVSFKTPKGFTRATGSNAEYGGSTFGGSDTRAFHAEESAVNNAREKGLGKIYDGEKSLIEISATVTDAAAPSPSCGNCLDVLKSYSHPKTLIVSGTTQEKQAIIHTFEDCLPTEFKRHNVIYLTGNYREALQVAIATAREYSFTPLSEPHVGPRGASIYSTEGIVPGPRIEQIDYHPITAVRSAIAHLRTKMNPVTKQAAQIGALFYVSRDGYISGRDRQSIYEATRPYGDHKRALVFMYGYDKHRNGNYPIDLSGGTLSVATPAELLPFGFSPTDLGLDGEVKRYLGR